MNEFLNKMERKYGKHAVPRLTTIMIALIYLMFEPLLMKIFGLGFEGYPIRVCAVTIIGDVLFGICVIMTIVSGVDYLIKGKQYLKG